jgi:ATP-dependent exoDNAse (exonuclease V) alpha subunit
MRHSATQRFAIVVVSLLWATALAAADKTTVKEFITEPATLVSLGFEWRIDGDDNRNATSAVFYRKKGEQAWKEGLPLLRIGNERINENALQYVTPNGFAGSIFDLEPATEYECRFVMKDPDGLNGKMDPDPIRERSTSRRISTSRFVRARPPWTQAFGFRA